jgi:type IX secretion system substrate protein
VNNYRKILTIIFTLFTLIFANPIDDSPTIFELQIIEPDNWIMEINGFDFMFENIDSIVIESLDGKSRIRECDTINTERGLLWILTQEDLILPLNMSAERDLIKLHMYFDNGRGYTKQVKIGNYPGSYLHNILPAQSIVLNMYVPTYYKSNSPSFGEYEIKDASAKIYGYFYNEDGTTIDDRFFRIYPGNFLTPCSEYIDSSGFYSANLGSKYYSYDQFYIWNPNLGGDYWNFELNEFDLEPGDSVQIDFYASQTGIIPVIENTTIKFNNYPHPASNYTWFFIDNTEIEASAMRVSVYALNGRKVDSFIPSAKQFRYDCAHLPQGSYVMSLQHGNDVLATKKLQILK